MTSSDRFGRIVFMTCLVIAGEAIFALPFHITRFFRPTVLEVFGLTATELGKAQAVYGVTAMLSYFPGGPIADRYSARTLLTASLVFTAAGGFYFATIPGYSAVQFLFGLYGVTTVLLFWAAMIRAAREWGGTDQQGRAYGILDGGRGLFAAVMATAAVQLFQLLMPADPTAATAAERMRGLQGIILTYTVATLAAAALVWFFVPDTQSANTTRRDAVLANVGVVVRLPTVWLQALIVVCAYVTYKGFDNYSLYAVDAWGTNEVEAARISAIGSWGRPIGAVLAGYLGDRYRSVNIISLGFGILLLSHLYFALVTPSDPLIWSLYFNVVVTCVAMFGIRGIYFALMQEGGVPLYVTGTAVGLISVVGYTPDIFATWVAGIFIDASPGVTGHQHFFWFLAAFTAVGLAASFLFRRVAPATTPR